MNRMLMILSIMTIFNIQLSQINCLHINNHHNNGNYMNNHYNHHNHLHNNNHNYQNNHVNQNKNGHKYYNLEQTLRVSQSRSIKYLNMCKDLCLSMHKIFPFQFKYHRLVYRQYIGDLKYIIGNCLYTFRINQSKPQNQQNQLNSNDLNLNDEDKNETINNMTKQSEQMNQSLRQQQQQKNNKQQNTINQHKQQHKQQNKQQQQRTWLSWLQLKKFIQMSPIHNQQYLKQLQTWQSYHNDCQDQTLKLQQSTKKQLKFNIIHSNFQYYQQNGFQNLSPFNDIETFITQINMEGSNI